MPKRKPDSRSVIQFMKLIVLDDVDQLFCVFRIGGIAGILQCVGPVAISRGTVIVEPLVSGLGQVLAEISVTVRDGGIFPKALHNPCGGATIGKLFGVFAVDRTVPVRTFFDAEVVVRPARQLACSPTAFQSGHGEDYGQWDSARALELYSQIIVLTNVGFNL